MRAYAKWAWLLANEPGFRLEFVPGLINMGADLLSRPGYKVNLPVVALEDEPKLDEEGR